VKVKDLQEARQAQSAQYEIIAEFLARGLTCLGDPYEKFLGLADNINPEGGLNKAVNYIQRWNIAAEFVKQYKPNAATKPVSKTELEDWVETWKDS